ncbi:hypothetical protein [Cupriavidus sp. D384]|uniref:hypothetical protein n=1 Tax=Cupriavidus sp. D384 TaxID=1538095 RepID=UPI0012E7D682|nr:hypothetical protein [Cupriavidus sp. D384]
MKAAKATARARCTDLILDLRQSSDTRQVIANMEKPAFAGFFYLNWPGPGEGDEPDA